jgi:hypothetical protein
MVSPSDVSERNCFGRDVRLFGQKRSPLPPAIITAVIFTLKTSFSVISFNFVLQSKQDA